MNRSIGCIVLVVVGIVLVVFLGSFVSSRNKMVDLDQAVQAQWGQVQNDYQRRADLIPNLVQTVQGYAKYEQATLTAVVQARAAATQVVSPGAAPGAQSNIPNDPAAFQKFEAAQSQLSGAIGRLLVVVEKYPDLKANQGFLQLQSQLEGTENRISVERRRYNETAQAYNAFILKFPANLVANFSGFKPKAYFTATTPGAETAPSVKFDFGNATSTSVPVAPPAIPAPNVPATATR
jgi:LemA protein